MDEPLITRVEQARLDDDLTYEKLAQKIGVSRATLHRLVDLRYDGNKRTRHKLQQYLEQRDTESRRGKTRTKRAAVA
jgi:ribosome-binding protein aMBF1 (putative translation factor)